MHQIVLAQALHQLQDPAGRRPAGLVRHRMRRLHHLDPLAGRAVAVAGDDQAGQLARPVPLERQPHRRRRLAGPDHDGPTRAAAAGRCAGSTTSGIGRRDGGVEQCAQEAPAAPRVQPSATGWFAISSSALTMAEWSQPLPPLAAQALNSSMAVAVLGRLTPSARAPASARLRSFWCSSIRKPGIEGALDHALAMHLEDARAGEAAHQRLAHLGRVGAGLGREHQRLGHRLDVQRHDDLVGDLGGLPVADRRRPG